jgi:hypothetical protein
LKRYDKTNLHGTVLLSDLIKVYKVTAMIVNTSYATDTDIVNAIKDRKIVCAFHDIDGTHSLIRNWPPVMSRVLYDTAMNGIPDNLTSEENINRLVELCDTEPLEETDRFCIESAGLSALTQMEWAIRRNQECINGKYNSEVNSKIIELIWAGKEKVVLGLRTGSKSFLQR